MKLLSLNLTNFKGTRDLLLEPNGNDMHVYGDNSAGKTTIADAFFWLLFDKDSTNRKDFEIKTLDSAGQVIHFLDHEVSAVFETSPGSKLELKKSYKENWTVTRGQRDKEFSGHTTDYKVNSVPVKKSEFDRWIADICDEKLWRRLSDPTYFNTQDHWQDRRKILIEVCGDVSDEDVIASNPKLSGLPAILAGRKLDDHRKMITARRKEINTQKEKIPTRIDELARSLPTVSGTVADISELRTKLHKLAENRARITAGGEVAEKMKRLRVLEGDAQGIINRLRLESSKSFEEAQAATRKAATAHSEAEAAAVRLQRELDADLETLARLEGQLDTLRKEFTAENARVFEFTGVDSCAACGQALPADKVEEARQKAQEEFNLRKSRKLSDNQTEGRSLKHRATGLQEDIKQKREKLGVLNAGVAQRAEERDRLKAAADSLEAPTLDLSGSAEYQANLTEQNGIKAEITSLQENTSSALQAIDQDAEALNAEVATREQANARLEAKKRTEARINELAAEERKLSGEMEKIDGELFLTDEFIRAKILLLTTHINSRFQHARFKLFDEQINGAVSEVCETTYLGVPYNSLNHGAKLNVGLDIINTLAEHYAFAPTIFIDNAESVTQIMPTRGQQIRLIVSEADKVLRPEVPETATKQEAFAI